MKTLTQKMARNGKPVLDAAQSIFFSRELEQIETRLYKVKYPDLEAEMLLPNRIMLPAGVDKYTWRLFDENAKAVPMAGHEDGAPVSDVDGDEQSASVQSWAGAFAYNIDEIAAAAHAGMPLEQMRADAVRRRLALALNTMALLGDSAAGVKAGIKGLFNLANTLTATIAADGTGSSKLWSTKTADLVLRDLFQIVDSIPNNTLDIEGGASRPMNLVMPKANLRLIGTMRLGTSASDTKVLEFFKRQRPNINVMGANYLPTAGASGASRTVCYDPAQVSWIGSIPFEQLPVEQKGYRFVTNCRARGGGVITPYPKSVLYADGC
jgi:hypothetical protein